MQGARWRNRIGPPVVVVMSAVLLTIGSPPVFAAGWRHASSAADSCPRGPAAAARAALVVANTPRAAADVKAKLGNRGELIGRVLSIRTVGPAAIGGGASVFVELPAESWVGEPNGDLVLYTRHTPATGSEVHALNFANGCDTRLAAPAEIVRSAVLDPTAAALYVHSVARADRSDAGVVRHDLGSGAAAQVLPGLAARESLGPIFGTELHWSLGGDELAVQSCGFTACLARVLDVVSNQVAMYNAAPQGQFIALTRDHVVTFAACGGLPCPVVSIDRHTNEVAILAEEALSASAAALAPGSPGGVVRGVIRIETAAGITEVVQ